MNDLLPVQPDKTDAFSRIQKFLSSEESGVTLSSKEELILARWIFANGLLTERKFLDDEIIDQIVSRFGVSKFTARTDISSARSLFISLVKDIKKFGLYHHIRDLEVLFQNKKNDKAYAPFIAKLADAITRAYVALPEENELPPVPAPVLILKVVEGNKISLDEAVKAADQMLAKSKGDYAEFEDVTNES
jgi:hypothetical protein